MWIKSGNLTTLFMKYHVSVIFFLSLFDSYKPHDPSLTPSTCLPAVLGVQLIVQRLPAGHQCLPPEFTGALLPHRFRTLMVLLLLLTAEQGTERETKKLRDVTGVVKIKSTEGLPPLSSLIYSRSHCRPAIHTVTLQGCKCGKIHTHTSEREGERESFG